MAGNLVDRLGPEAYALARWYAAIELRRELKAGTNEEIEERIEAKRRVTEGELAATLSDRTERARTAQRNRERAFRDGQPTWERDYGNYTGDCLPG